MRKLLGRIRAAAALLFLPGDRTPVTRHDLRRFEQEWLEWEITFNSILEKLNAWQARQAKREKRALARLDDDPASSGPQQPLDKRSLKLELSRRLVAGGGLPQPPPRQAHPENGGDGE